MGPILFLYYEESLVSFGFRVSDLMYSIDHQKCQIWLCHQIVKSCLFFCSPYLKIGNNRFSMGNNRFWRFVVFEEKITGFTFVTAFRYFPIFFLTRITGNRKITAFRTSCRNQIHTIFGNHLIFF